MDVIELQKFTQNFLDIFLHKKNPILVQQECSVNRGSSHTGQEVPDSQRGQ